jgi:hypothetical protein
VSGMNPFLDGDLLGALDFGFGSISKKS